MNNYGKELILDLHDCDVKKFSRKELTHYFRELCLLIDMERAKLVWWDDVGVPKKDCQTNPRTKGTSAVQFILTSNITVHTLVLLKRVYINIFSCKGFNSDVARIFTTKFFCGEVVHWEEVKRV